MSDASIFDDHGYLNENVKSLTYLQAKNIIAEEIMATKQLIEKKVIEKKEKELLLPLKNYLSCLQHSDRTVWLLYKNEKKISESINVQTTTSDESPTKTFTVTFPDKSEKYIKNVYSYRVSTESGILYLKDGNGEIIAAFNEWWSFTIKEERLDEH